MPTFVKIYDSILHSSVWLEPAPTRLVWITMLTLADKNGCVRASVGGLAHAARVTRDEARAALACLEGPDEDSRTPDYEGRRIEKVEGGWIVLNHGKYRDLRTEDQIAAAARKRRQRQRQKDEASELRDTSRDSEGQRGTGRESPGLSTDTDTEADPRSEAEEKQTPDPSTLPASVRKEQERLAVLRAADAVAPGRVSYTAAPVSYALERIDTEHATADEVIAVLRSWAKDKRGVRFGDLFRAKQWPDQKRRFLAPVRVVAPEPEEPDHGPPVDPELAKSLAADLARAMGGRK